MGTVSIERVATKADLKAFLQLPWAIYQDHDCWVPPLLAEVDELLDVKRHPFWAHARRELFLARRQGEVVGRIAAIVDDLHNQTHQDQIGFFGFFECQNDGEAAQALYDEAGKWLKTQGKTAMRGPVNPSMNDECAFLLEGFDKPPSVMMPYTPEYYLALAEGCGLKKVKDLYALILTKEGGIPERITRMIDVIKKRTKVKIRPLEMKYIDRDIQILKDIYNAAWEKNWGFVPMTDAEIDLTAKKIKQFIDPNLVLFAEVDGLPVGVTVTVPDINPVLKRMNGKMGPLEMVKWLYYKKKVVGVRSLIGGVKAEYRKSGIIAALFYETRVAGERLGYEWCEMGWNLEDNDLINQFDMAIGGKIYKKYRLVEKAI